MISLILAIGKNNEIGFGNKLPWHLPDDLKRFRDTTRGHTVIMGRKTYESIGRLLPDRKNIIITRDTSYQVAGAVIAHNIEEAIKECKNEKEAFVIGGGEIVKLAMPYLKRMYLTHVEADIPADSFFPPFDESEWKITSEKFHPKDEKHPYEFTFKTYEKI
ncbi:MAG: dihydrofolate reductase [Patescibacteria group bacterium]